MDDKRRRFDAEVLTHLDAAYRFARWLAGTSGDAEDVVQDAVLRAYRGFDSLRGSDARAWLLAIVRNCHYTSMRRARRQAWVPLPDEQDATDGHVLVNHCDPESASLQDEAHSVLERLMNALPEEQREVLVLRDIEELSYREIAQVAGIPIGTVMSRLARARAALRQRWAEPARGCVNALR